MRHEPGSGWIIGLGDDFKSDGSRAESRGQIVESRIAVAQLAGKIETGQEKNVYDPNNHAQYDNDV